MTAKPLQEVRSVHARLYQAQQLLADVRCRLWPADAPLRGTALIPGHRDWLLLGTLLLTLSSGERYRVVPTSLDQSASGESLLTFCVGLQIAPTN
jgi:hypothetical protein